MFDFGSIFSGIGSFIGGQATAAGYGASADSLEEAARVTKLSGELKLTAIRRAAFGLKGTAMATAGGSGLKASGSALDVINNNAQQMGLTRAVTALNTKNEYQSLMSQAKQAKKMEKSSKWGSVLGLAGGLIGGFFSDDDLKEDVIFVGRRGDGIGIYEFSYKGTGSRYRGVLASEIEVLRPDAIIEDGEFRRVDYDKLGIKFEKVTDAETPDV